MVIVHDLVLLFEVIKFANISLLVGLFLEVLFYAMRVAIVSIIFMMTIVLAFVVIKLVASMMVKVLATMMPVMAASGRKMSRFLLLWLFLLLELVKETATLLDIGTAQKRP
jgi:hypothetical protein